MNRYVSTMPRSPFIIGALAMAVLSLGASVAPAWQGAGAREAATLAHPAVDGRVATEVAIIPARIEVVGERAPRTALGAVRQLFTRAQSS